MTQKDKQALLRVRSQARLVQELRERLEDTKAAIGAAAMMLDFLGEKDAAKAIEKSIEYVTGNKLKSMAAGKMGYSTTEVGDLVVENL